MVGTQPDAVSKPDGLRRELYPIHIFAIAISTVIGMGFYVRVGVLEHLGGQAAVIYAYGFLGALCLMIMTCLAIMLRIWPIAGAIVVFVERFVDPDIGQSVGVLYWLTYCFSFAGLTTGIGQLVSYLDLETGPSVLISVASLVLPILFNLTDIQVFRNIELVMVSIKLSIVMIIIVVMNVINPKVGETFTTQAPSGMFYESIAKFKKSAVMMLKADASQVRSRDVIFQEPNDGNWFGILMTSIFLASFSYVGIEVVAATAQEAKGGNDGRSKTHTDREEPMSDVVTVPSAPSWMHDNREDITLTQVSNGSSLAITTAPSRNSSTHQETFRHRDRDQSVAGETTQTENARSVDGDSILFNPSYHDRKSPFQGPARYVPVVSAVLYLWGAWAVTQNVAWDDQSQPSLAGNSPGWSSSIFINSAKKSNVPGLDRALTGLLIINIASCSSTALYVASRTLFGLTFTISKEMELNPPSQAWRKRWLSLMNILSKKSKFDVPYVAVLISAWGLILPFLKYVHGNSYLKAIDVVTEMGSVSCILVWGWESFATFRFFRCCKRHPDALGAINENIVNFEDKGWYYFHLLISLFASIMCPIIVFVGGAFTFLYNTNATQGVATFLVVAIFVGLTLVFKVIRWYLDPDPWWSLDRFLRNLNEGGKVKKMFGELDTLATKHIDKNHETTRRSWLDLGGVIDSKWLFNKLRRK